MTEIIIADKQTKAASPAAIDAKQGPDTKASDAAAEEDPPTLAAGDDLSVRWAQSSKAYRRRSLPLWAKAVAGVIVAALIAAVVVGGLRLRHDEQLASARSSAMATASSDAKMIATYSYASFDTYAKNLEARSTAKFSASFKSDTSGLLPVLTQYKAGSKGSVSGVGAGAVTTSTATVYVFLDETVSNTKSTSSTERARMVISLIRQNGRWLMTNAVVE